MHRSQEIVLFLFQHIVVIGHAWRHQLHDATLHQFLGQFRVFKLLTHSHFQSGTNQLGQIGIQGMVWKARQFDVGRGAVGAFGQHNAKNLG